MFSSFLKITPRNLYRERMYALINISGLSIAIACCMVFLFSAVLAAGVAFITVALQSYKTAQANPVNALRYE